MPCSHYLNPIKKKLKNDFHKYFKKSINALKTHTLRTSPHTTKWQKYGNKIEGKNDKQIIYRQQISIDL